MDLIEKVAKLIDEYGEQQVLDAVNEIKAELEKKSHLRKAAEAFFGIAKQLYDCDYVQVFNDSVDLYKNHYMFSHVNF